MPHRPQASSLSNVQNHVRGIRPDIQKAKETYEKQKIEGVIDDDKTRRMVLGNFEDWIKIMVASYTYQDPMNPMDPSETAAQFAAFGQVIGLLDVKEELKKSTEMHANNQLLQAASQINRLVEFKGDKFYFSPEQTAEVFFTPPAEARYCRLVILDPQHHMIAAKTVEATPERKMSFTWDGLLQDGTTAPRGSYLVKVLPLDQDKKVLVNPKTKKDFDVATTIRGEVSGGLREKGKPMLLMGGEGGAFYPLETMMAIYARQTPNRTDQPVSTILQEH